MNTSFWSDKKVFITGHTGFKGSWLSLWLQQLGADVTGYALHPPTKPSLFEAAKVTEGMISIIGDIRDDIKLINAVRKSSPDVVFHMAAQPLVRRSYKNPVETYSTNVMGTVNLLEAVRQTPNVRAVVNVTTDKCYENKEWPWGYRENESMGGFDPYSSSKGCAELVTAAYRQSFFNSSSSKFSAQTAVATARAGNVIGGGDWAEDRLIPDILRAIESGDCIHIRNPLATRPWQHVLEPLSGYLVLAEKLTSESGQQYAEGWNFGPREDDVRPVKWIVEKMIQYWGNGTSWQPVGGIHPHEAHYLKLDISKAKARLDWQPKWQLSSALEHVLSWHKSYLQGVNVRDLTLQQINTYVNQQKESKTYE
jgi:CDP-glucose 4,6-dehydratase